MDELYILIIVDLASRFFFMAAVIHDNHLEFQLFFFHRELIFGVFKKFLLGNGGKFKNTEINQLSETVNIKIKTMATESPQNNGVCVWMNVVIDW